MPVHTQLATLDIATATETTLAAAAGDSLNVQQGDGWKNPELVGFRAVSANTQYGRIRHMRNATGIYFPGTTIAGTIQHGGYHILDKPQPLTEGELLQIRALQDSGGNEESQVIYLIRYNGRLPVGGAVKDVQTIRAASTVNTVADAWTRTILNCNNTYAGFELEQGQRYCVLSAQVIGANAQAARLTIGGGAIRWPVGTATDVAQAEPLNYIKEFGEAPLLNHPSAIDVEVFSEAAEASLAYITLGKI